MNKKQKYYLALCLLLPLFSIAQSNYKAGLVVNLKGDTLHGFINFKEWNHNPTDISFKPALNDKSQQLNVADINSFEIRGYVSYHAYTVKVSMNAVDESSPSSAADTARQTDRVFLMELNKGRYVTLYSYKDNIKQRFYIKENNADIPTELFYGIYQDANGSDKVTSRKTYQSQLNQLVFKYNNGDDKLVTKVQQSDYKVDDLASIVDQINGDAQSHLISASYKNSTAVRFFGGLGVLLNTIVADQYYGSPRSTSQAPKIAGGIDLIVNPAVGHLVFRAEFAYSVNNYSFTYAASPLYQYNGGSSATTVLKVKQNDISITPQAIYNVYNGQIIKVFVDLGYCLNILSYSSSGDFDSKGNYSTFQFKGGVVIAKKLEIYGAYSPKAGLSTNLDHFNNISSYQVGINYYFGKANQ